MWDVPALAAVAGWYTDCICLYAVYGEIGVLPVPAELPGVAVMLIVHIEIDLDVWETRTVTFAERQALLLASRPEQRFVQNEEVYIAHPLNPWCIISDFPFESVDWGSS